MTKESIYSHIRPTQLRTEQAEALGVNLLQDRSLPVVVGWPAKAFPHRGTLDSAKAPNRRVRCFLKGNPDLHL